MKHKWKIFTITAVLIIVLAFTACVNSGGGDTKASIADSAKKTGDTISTMKKSQKDGKLHKISYKITRVIRNEDKVNSIIKKYNASGKATTLPDPTDNSLKYCVVRYKVKYPDSFPAREYGITNPELKFRITNENGGKTIKYNGTEYEGLYKTWEIGNEPMGYDFYPGDQYKGSFVFLMAKGCKAYLFEESYKDGNKTVKNYIKP